MRKSQVKPHGRDSAGLGLQSTSFGSSSTALSYIQEPPDYSRITDSNVVVSFKNLSKKDGTTKAKAIEDLQHFLSSADEIDDAVVEAWVRLYPRLSIDNARRVRQLAHGFTGQLSAKCGKRIAKQLPQIIGPWLAGAYDADRAASKAAKDALSAVFPSLEKLQALRKTFHEPILDYCRDAVLEESEQTLSDTRTASPDDAASVYARVVSGSIAVISSLLDSLPTEELSKHMYQYESILSDARLWKLPSHSNADVRKAMYKLVQNCIDKLPTLIEGNVKAVSNAFVNKALPSDQTGSAVEFAQTLAKLTVHLPTIWTEAYAGKKPASTRLRECLEHGARSGPASFWVAIGNVVHNLPDNVLPTEPEVITRFLTSAQEGVAKDRFNASSAWPFFFTLVDAVTSPLSAEDSEVVLGQIAMPVLTEYLRPSGERTSRTVSGAKAASTVANVVSVKKFLPLMERSWPGLADELIESARTSQPEQSKDFNKSQSNVAAAGERWADLQGEFYKPEHSLPATLRTTLTNSNTKVLTECVALLTSRSGKPYGAAAIIEAQLRACRSELMQDKDFKLALTDFVVSGIPSMIISPSQQHLGRCVFAISESPEFSEAFQNVLRAILDADEPNKAKLKTLSNLFAGNTPEPAVDLARGHAPLQTFLATQTVVSPDDHSTGFFSNLLKAGVVSQSSIDTVLSKITEGLSVSGHELQSTLTTFDHILKTNEPAVRSFIARPEGSGTSLLPTILRLEQSPDDAVATKAALLSTKLSSNMGSAATDATQNIIVQNLAEVDRTSLPIDAVIDLATRLADQRSEDESVADLLPNVDVWRSSILAAAESPRLSLGILSPIGGAVHLVRPDASASRKEMRYDAEGLSQPLRTALYLVHLLSKTKASQLGEAAPELMALLCICVLLVEDATNILAANSIWKPTLELDMLEFMSEANASLRSYRESDRAVFFNALEKLRASEASDSPMSYYASLASAKAHDDTFELQGFTSDQAKAGEETLNLRRSGKDTLALVSCIVGFAEPLNGNATLTRLCNQLVADLTGLKIESDERLALEKLIVLNAILHTQEDAVGTIAKSRLVFFVKQVVPRLESTSSPAVKAETFKTLTYLLPGMADMYGEHWTNVLAPLITFWESSAMTADGESVSEAGILTLHASLRLYAALRKLSKSEDPNEDLVEALSGTQEKASAALIGLLQYANNLQDEHHQPLMVTNELLGRQISQLPRKALQDAEDLYPLLYAPSRAIQGAAFDLLHQHIPATQEQISFDAALENKKAQLPDELLSLILDAPTLDSLADAAFDRMMPVSLQGYLYSWRLLFDHFNGSSFRVKSDYVEQLKDGAYLNGLLSLTFDFLGLSRLRPIDASKFDVQEYLAGSEPSPEKDVQWLLVHLYYLTLAHLPNLAKTYFLEIRSRQVPQAIESWTAKYVSPLIIAADLRTVAEWAEKNVKEDPEYEAMSVKVGMRSREIAVNYLVDDQVMGIKVVLPETYPLGAAQVISINRVAVREEKWQSWLRNCQGMMTFTSGSITDALSAWRKNVHGALQGHTECSICYSMVNQAKELPTKRCPTCKNMFHGVCLMTWFRKSGASTCPLCRNQFNFNG